MAEIRRVDRTTTVGGIEINRVLRNTYMLLGLTLAFSACVALVSMSLRLPYLGFIPTLVGFFALLFLVHKTADSIWGLASVFALTGFMGYSLGPLLAIQLSLPHGPALVSQALGLTAAAFIGLSLYALITRQDFSFLRGFLIAGFIVLIGGLLVGYFMNIAGLYTALAVGFMLVASALILFETSRVINGGETNYIRATVGLYVAIYNIFVSLLHLLGIGSD
jgi:modulator of FtsH protease